MLPRAKLLGSLRCSQRPEHLEVKGVHVPPLSKQTTPKGIALLFSLLSVAIAHCCCTLGEQKSPFKTFVLPVFSAAAKEASVSRLVTSGYIVFA